jgi:hypothetical protein
MWLIVSGNSTEFPKERHARRIGREEQRKQEKRQMAWAMPIANIEEESNSALETRVCTYRDENDQEKRSPEKGKRKVACI